MTGNGLIVMIDLATEIGDRWRTRPQVQALDPIRGLATNRQLEQRLCITRGLNMSLDMKSAHVTASDMQI